MKTEYQIRCLGTSEVISDDNLPLSNPKAKIASLLKAEYANKRLEVKDASMGLYKFSDWMPICRFLDGSSAPVTYKSEHLAREIGLENLYITFNGYWPERGAFSRTGTFKEYEAFSVCARMPENFGKTLVVASVGNTARAFAQVCSTNTIPLVVVVPERSLESMWFTEKLNPCVKLIAAGDDSDYYDAITLADLICKEPGFVAEGGAKNIARRDGMGTTVLSAVTTIGRIPDYYFQAVGSGTGAIAAWEANQRLIEDGRYGSTKMKLYLSQNAPFLLIHDSWKRGGRELVELSSEKARKYSDEILATVLSNRKPPYSIQGGLFDALLDTGGDVFPVTNDEAIAASGLFEKCEGIDLSPAAAVGVGSLIKAARERIIDPASLVMMNVTGGGIKKIKNEKQISYLKPFRTIPRKKISEKSVAELVIEIGRENNGRSV